MYVVHCLTCPFRTVFIGALAALTQKLSCLREGHDVKAWRRS